MGRWSTEYVFWLQKFMQLRSDSCEFYGNRLSGDTTVQIVYASCKVIVVFRSSRRLLLMQEKFKLTATGVLSNSAV